MKTVTLQIGNSDNKLTQEEWHYFVAECQKSIEKHAKEIHFFGGSPNWYPWQNVAWIFCGDNFNTLKCELKDIRQAFRQESIAWSESETEFV